MRNAKYLALALVLIIALVVPAGTLLADSDRPDNPSAKQLGAAQFADLTGRLKPLSNDSKRYAIVVGSNYESLPDDTVILPFVPPFGVHLNWAVNDALAMSGLLSGFDNVQTLIGAGPSGASRDNILAAIRDVSRRASEDDEVVFYFSGHGAQKLRSDEGEDRGNASEGIVTDEGDKVDYLWDKDLASAFRRIESERVVFIFDECFSGGMTELSGPGRLVLSSTTKHGISVEDAAPGDPANMGIDHGFFTFFLMSALTGNSAQTDGMVSAVLGVLVQNPYASDRPVSMEQAFDYASWSLQAISPLVSGGLTLYFGPDIASHWGTPTVIDGFRGDLVL